MEEKTRIQENQCESIPPGNFHTIMAVNSRRDLIKSPHLGDTSAV